MSSFKRLNKADVTTTLYSANKSWNISYTTSASSNAYYYTGSNRIFNINEQKGNGQYPSLIYSLANHLFYQSYTSSLDTGSLMFNINTYESASQQRPTASYFNYNSNPLLIKQFPTESEDIIGLLSINKNLYGNKILPNSFQISASSPTSQKGILIKDDGYGNLYDIAGALSLPVNLGYVTLDYFETGDISGTGIEFVGNIFYAHGITVITKPSYKNLLNVNPCQQYTLSGAIFIFVDCFGRTRLVNASSLTTVCASFAPVAEFGGTVTPGVSCTVSKLLTFQNEYRIYENEIRCIVKESDYNLSYNPTLLKYGAQTIVPISGSAGNGYTITGSFDNSTVKDFATASFFQPYVTTIGLYNDNNDLLMVAKLAKPIMLSPDTDTTFIVKYDL